MQTGRLILLLLLILVAAVVVGVVLRRASARKDEQRAQAAGLRSEAEGMAATVAGQDAFAQQARERAEVARVEAEERAREAARLEAEAEQRRADAEATRREYEATMRRADDIDPDVSRSQFPPVPADLTPTTSADAGEPAPAATSPSSDAAEPAPAATSPSADAGEPAQGTTSQSSASSAPETGGDDTAVGSATAVGATAAGATAVGAVPASTWRAEEAARADDDVEGSRRIASGADFADEVPGDTVSAAPATGSGTAMSHEYVPTTDADTRDEVVRDAPAATSRDAESPRGEWGGPPADADERATADERAAVDRAASDDGAAEGGQGAEGVHLVSDTDDYASTEPLTTDEQTPPVTPAPATERDDEQDTARDASPSAHDTDTSQRGEASQHQGDVEIVSDTDAFAATEPVTASGDATSRTASATHSHDADHSDDHGVEGGARAADPSPGARASDDDVDHVPGEHAPAETGAAVVDPQGEGEGTAADRAAEPTRERFDPTPTRDWGADEGELLEENHDRGERLAQDRRELEEEAQAGPGGTATSATDSLGGDTASAGDTASGTSSPAARRISEFHELRDGGYGVGSAAPLEDRAQPMDHPVQAFRDSMTYRAPGDADYDSAEPDVWFYDEGAAERSGFRRHGG